MNAPDHARLRVSNLQRDNAVHVLRDAAADGRLSFDELTSRVAVALAATTRGDLAAVLDDLVPVEQLDAAIADPSVKGEGPGFRWDDPLVIENTGLGDTNRVGRWVLPPFVEVVTGLGTVRLNCMDAAPGADLIDISIVAGMGAVILVVPEGWGVDTSGVQASGAGASVTTRVRTRPEQGRPRIVLRGRSEGSVRVRHPGWFDRRASERARRELTPGP